MHERNRFAYAALGLVAGLGLSMLFLVAAVPEFRDPTIYKFDQSSTDDRDNTQGQDAATNENPDEPQWRRWTRRLVATEDTLAQWVMAFFSIAATGVSYLAVRLVGATLELNRTATAAAVDAAESAKRSVETDRAWLVFDSFQVVNLNSSNQPVGMPGLGVIIRWRNAGKTPATRADLFVNFTATSAVGIPSFSIEDGLFDNSHNVVGPGSVAEGPIQKIDGVTAELIRKNLARLHVYSRVEYRDLFNKEVVRYSEACAHIRYNGSVLVNGVPEPHITLTFVGPQNGIT